MASPHEVDHNARSYICHNWGDGWGLSTVTGSLDGTMAGELGGKGLIYYKIFICYDFYSETASPDLASETGSTTFQGAFREATNIV